MTPARPFSQTFQTWLETGAAWLLMVGGAFLMAGIFVGRPYCRWLCPYGALLSAFSRYAWRPFSITPDRELDCGLCQSACPYGAIRWQKKEVATVVEAACAGCGACGAACKQGAVTMRHFTDDQLLAQVRGILADRPDVYTLRPELSRVRRPTLVLRGARDRGVARPAAFLAHNIPGAEEVVIPGVGRQSSAVFFIFCSTRAEISGGAIFLPSTSTQASPLSALTML